MSDLQLAGFSKSQIEAMIEDIAPSALDQIDAIQYMGVKDCSVNPKYPAADAGHIYIVSIAGKIGGASGIEVEAGDLLICNTDDTAEGVQAAVGASWNVVQGNLIIKAAGAPGGVLASDDPTTTNSRTPTAHVHTLEEVTGLVAALSDVQPLDNDLTSISGLTTTSFGRSFLPLADAVAAQALLELGTAALAALGIDVPTFNDSRIEAAKSQGLGYWAPATKGEARPTTHYRYAIVSTFIPDFYEPGDLHINKEGA